MGMLISQGHVIIQIDAALFSNKAHPMRVYAPVGFSPYHKPAVDGGHYTCAMGAICEELGLVHLRLSNKKAFNAYDVADFLFEIKEKMGSTKFAAFLDNATIHRAIFTKQAAQLMGVPLVFNLPYRPDLNGIEFLWNSAKHAFRARVKTFRGVGIKWSNKEEADAAIRGVKPDLVKLWARKGMTNIMNAQAIVATPDEVATASIHRLMKALEVPEPQGREESEGSGSNDGGSGSSPGDSNDEFQIPQNRAMDDDERLAKYATVSPGRPQRTCTKRDKTV